MRVPVAAPESVVMMHQQPEPEGVSLPLPPLVTFEVHAEMRHGLWLLCPEASLHDDWREKGSVQLFSCRCPVVKEKEPRHREVESIACE